MALECRLQFLTESKDIMQKELEENNCWYDNQQHLIEELKKVNMLVAELKLANDQLLEQLHQYKEEHGNGKCHKMVHKEVITQPERMSITSAAVKDFFRKGTGE